MANTTSYLSIFNLKELSRTTKVDYDRLYHISRGARQEGFTPEEVERLSKVILKAVNHALEEIGSHNRVTSID